MICHLTLFLLNEMNWPIYLSRNVHVFSIKQSLDHFKIKAWPMPSEKMNSAAARNVAEFKLCTDWVCRPNEGILEQVVRKITMLGLFGLGAERGREALKSINCILSTPTGFADTSLTR